MSPSQIIKSAYARECAAGYNKSLKSFVYKTIDVACEIHNVIDEHDLPKDVDPFVTLCRLWLGRKLAQRQQARGCARSARRGHVDIHQRQQARSIANTMRGAYSSTARMETAR
jgi:hypothetical protein